VRAICQVAAFLAALTMAVVAMIHNNYGLAGITFSILYLGLVEADV